MKLRHYLLCTVLSAFGAFTGAEILVTARAFHQAAVTPSWTPTVQELPDAVVNAPPIRNLDDSGVELLEHGGGW